MRQKPYICKREGRWFVIKPTFGFRPTPDFTEHDSLDDAINSMRHVVNVHAPGCSSERKWSEHYGWSSGGMMPVFARNTNREQQWLIIG